MPTSKEKGTWEERQSRSLKGAKNSGLTTGSDGGPGRGWAAWGSTWRSSPTARRMLETAFGPVRLWPLIDLDRDRNGHRDEPVEQSCPDPEQGGEGGEGREVGRALLLTLRCRLPTGKFRSSSSTVRRSRSCSRCLFWAAEGRQSMAFMPSMPLSEQTDLTILAGKNPRRLATRHAGALRPTGGTVGI